ncbi:hypothetical protein SAMN05216480_101154 [Pustulibacterium marinum]|uniref:Uncharacterized protein n=1 Tax=Pustulibacterium marinum TaxID=1224947 RepID=A0A1I7ETY0_9FLAO|nr:DUF6168 family protein [Pustulibacterium marinum]SFU27385.1 hypothetical protein SAMN05216480_101154 [Pustulibacterium marinum]
MSSTFQKLIFVFLLLSILSFVLIWGLHESVLTNTIHLTVNGIFLFHFGITLLILIQLYLINKKLPEQLGFIFLGMITLKLILVGVYLAPHITQKEIYTNSELTLFAIPYFIFLTFEVYFTKQLLDKKIT